MSEGDDDVLREFLIESGELVDQAEHELMEMEKGPRKELFASVFRAFHTIKGTSGFFGFKRVQAVTHAAEAVLAKLRDGTLSATPDCITTLLKSNDAVRQMLTTLDKSGSEGDQDHAELLEALTRIVSGEPADTQAAAPKPSKQGAKASEAARVETPKADTPKADAAKVEAQRAEAPRSAPATQAPRAEAEHKPEEEVAAEGGEAGAASSSTLRVDVARLEKLMNLVGELVLARNQLLQLTGSREDVELGATSQRLNLITSELQEQVMRARMQPIGRIWAKLPRVIRDLASQTGKKARLEMIGRDTELDKTIIEAIKDPLTHMVRNAVDHGIESPDVRAKAGKPAEGTIVLRAFHEGGQVNIEMSDDGGGINTAKVVESAVKKGLIEAERAEALSDRQAAQLIFLPGLSTASKLTDVSGRGVGMDVVRTNIEKIGGTVDVHSTPGVGTTIKIKIPLTLAIIPALIVTCETHQYAIPQASLLELVRLDGEQATQGIEHIHGAPVYRLRGSLLPLVFLDKVLELERADKPNVANIVVLRADDRQFGLVVDDVVDTEEIVVKPLGRHLKGLLAYAGATILGDGRVALILDVLGLAQHAGVVDEAREDGLRVEAAGEDTATGVEGAQKLLIVRGAGNERLAVPLSLVSRLEEVKESAIERSGVNEFIQYRGSILPLVRLSMALIERRKRPRGPPPPPSPSPSSEGEKTTLDVVVYRQGQRTVGLVVEQILDIVEERIVLQGGGSRPGVLGVAVIKQRVTELLDLDALTQLAAAALPTLKAQQEVRS